MPDGAAISTAPGKRTNRATRTQAFTFRSVLNEYPLPQWGELQEGRLRSCGQCKGCSVICQAPFTSFVSADFLTRSLLGPSPSTPACAGPVTSSAIISRRRSAIDPFSGPSACRSPSPNPRSAAPRPQPLFRACVGSELFLVMARAFLGGDDPGVSVATSPTTSPKTWRLIPLIVHVHAIVFVSWLVLFTVQILLIRFKKLPVHRKLGMAMVARPVTVILGPSTAWTVQHFSEHRKPHAAPGPSQHPVYRHPAGPLPAP